MKLVFDLFTVKYSGASIAPLGIHRCNHRPLVSYGVVLLRSAQPVMSVESAHRVDYVVQQNDAYIAPATAKNNLTNFVHSDYHHCHLHVTDYTSTLE